MDFVAADAGFGSRAGRPRELGELGLADVEVAEEVLLFPRQVLVDAAQGYWLF